MNILKFKKYLGLCQCKGCMKAFSTVATLFYKNKTCYHAFLCEEHAAEALLDPIVRYFNGNS